MKPFDLTKIRGKLEKTLKVKLGFHNPLHWIDTGNFALNYRISNDFRRGIPLSKVTVFAGESGSGKSYFASGNLIKNAMDMGIAVILMDSEDAVDKDWIKRLGVDPDNAELIQRVPVTTVNDCASTVTEVMNLYMEQNEGKSPEEMPPILFVVDSLGMLGTPNTEKQFDDGDMKGDMGLLAKQLKAFVKGSIAKFSGLPVGMVATNHTYQSQDMFKPGQVVSGGAGFVYAASIVVLMNKMKLKLDEDGNKITEVRGIRAKMAVEKSRYAKPFEEVEVHIPYDTGMSAYSGLIEMFEKMGVLKKDGNKLKYVAADGTEHKHFRKNIDNALLDLIMSEWKEPEHDDSPLGFDNAPEEFKTVEGNE